MFLRLRTHLAALERAARAEALADARKGEVTRLAVELTDARREIRRLTDIIVALKREDRNVPAGYGDERWGSYNMEEEERAQLSQTRKPLPPLSNEEAIAEAELRRDLEAAGVL